MLLNKKPLIFNFYFRDQCTDDQLYEESMSDLNCTWPFLDFDKTPSWNEICQNETLIESLTEEIAPKYVQKKGSQCLDPCQYVKIDASETARTSFNPNPKIIFHFAQSLPLTHKWVFLTESRSSSLIFNASFFRLLINNPLKSIKFMQK